MLLRILLNMPENVINKRFDIWLRELNETKATAPMTTNKITNHFVQTSRTPQPSTYSPNHSRQVELLKSIVDDLITKLGLPLSIVDRPAFVNFMKIINTKFALMSRSTLSRTIIPS